MPFNGKMGKIEYLIETSGMPVGGGSMANTEALRMKKKQVKKSLYHVCTKKLYLFSLSHFLTSFDKFVVFVESITRSGVGSA